MGAAGNLGGVSGGVLGTLGVLGLRICCFGASVKGYDLRDRQSEGL